MKIYLGSRDVKPKGYKTVDISPNCNPDIVADITNMPQIADESCSEVVASHVLEHLAWPESFKALTEMTRILKIGGVIKIAVPDMRLLSEIIKSGSSSFFAAGMIFGAGSTNYFDQHHYGFTAEMLIQILSALGFSDFDWWKSTLPEGANGWMYHGSEKIAVSLNIQATKQSDVTFDTGKMFELLKQFPMEEFEKVLTRLQKITPGNSCSSNPLIYQRIHFQLIEARQRIAYLEKMLEQSNG